MTILIEAINVVIKKDSLKKIFGDNVEEFQLLIPNESNYQDAKLERVGFMDEYGVNEFISTLRDKGLRLLDENGYFDDFAIVCQGQKLKYKCNWLEIFNIKVEDKILELCAFKDSSGKIFLEKDKNSFNCSDGWTLDGAVQFHQNKDEAAKYLRTKLSEDGGVLDVYINNKGQLNYVGRNKRWFDYPVLCLLRMPLRLCSITSIIGLITAILFIPINQTLIYKSVWGFFIGGLFGLILTAQFANTFPMTPNWIKKLLSEK
tara:strand:+ start:369 stop:1148 length:780 start_codon:yes stop_codon:yes gene_type:complete